MPKERTREELEKLKAQTMVFPTTSGTMEHLQDESLMLFSYSYHNKKRYRLFYGIGKVYRVVRGERQDLIYMNFGIFKDKKTRLVVVFDNHARRQIMTLKRGQVCQVYGLCRYFTTTINLKGIETKGVRLGLYAYAINGWYVPTVLDIRKMPVNADLVAPTEKEEEIQETFEDVLDEFFNGKGEEL